MPRDAVVMRLFVIGLMVVFASGCAADRDLQPQTEQRVVAVNGSEVPVEQAEHDKRIDYIELPTTDISAAKAFYTGVFGWKTQDWGPDYTSFEDGRLAGGFRKEAEVTPGGPLVVLYAVDLEAVAAAVPQPRGSDRQRDFQLSRGTPFPFHRPQWQRTGGVVGQVKRSAVDIRRIVWRS